MFHRKKANKIQNTKYERKIKTNNSALNWSNSSSIGMVMQRFVGHV